MFWTPTFVSLVTFCFKFCLRSRLVGAPSLASLPPSVTAATFGAASGAGSTKFMQALFLRGQFLKTRIVADLIPHRIESQQRRSNRRAALRYLQQPLEHRDRVISIPT